MSDKVWEYQVTFWRAEEMEADYHDSEDAEAAMEQLKAEIEDAVGQGIVAGLARVESRKLSEYPS